MHFAIIIINIIIRYDNSESDDDDDEYDEHDQHHNERRSLLQNGRTRHTMYACCLYVHIHTLYLTRTCVRTHTHTHARSVHFSLL